VHATCPKCSQVITVDDSKVPAGPFMLRCPKCQETMKMPGRSQANATGVSEEEKSPPPPRDVSQAAPPPPSPAAKDDSKPLPPPQKAPEPGGARETAGGNGGRRALVWLPDTNQASAMSRLLERSGYRAEYIDVWDQKIEEIHQGRYDVIATHRNGASASGEKDLFKVITMLPPETRRRIFVALVGEEFKTGSGTQAFTAMADIVCHPQELDSADIVFRSSVAERARFYRSFLEVEDNL
jgi:predicted Zn finger-like uncharacterized protein